MSRRPGASRRMWPPTVCALLWRAGWRCAWCAIDIKELGAATLDHLDGDASNNAPMNLVASCVGCNSARAWDWTSGEPWHAQRALEHLWPYFAAYLARKGATIAEAVERVELERITSLEQFQAQGLATALERYPKRMAYLRKPRARRAKRENLSG